MIIISDNLDGIHNIKTFLNLQFKIKDLGTLRYFLALRFPLLPIYTIFLKPNMFLSLVCILTTRLLILH